MGSLGAKASNELAHAHPAVFTDITGVRPWSALTDHSLCVCQVVVFNVDERPVPIVHRIIRVHEKDDHSVDVLTKVRVGRADRVLEA